MTETLETLLRTICASVEKNHQNSQQTLYLLSGAQDAKLAYDLLLVCGVDTKYFDDGNNSAKLYVQNTSLAACGEKLAASLASASVLKQIKNALDGSPVGDYSLSFATTAAGQQLSVLFTQTKPAAVVANGNSEPPAQPSVEATAAATAPARPKVDRYAVKEKTEEEKLIAGPSVARKAVPKSMQTSATGEDPLSKRIFLYLTGRSFSAVAWMVFVAMALGFIFSIIITVRGFLCPDVATDVRNIPSYCPRVVAKPQQ